MSKETFLNFSKAIFNDAILKSGEFNSILITCKEMLFKTTNNGTLRALPYFKNVH